MSGEQGFFDCQCKAVDNDQICNCPFKTNQKICKACREGDHEVILG